MAIRCAGKPARPTPRSGHPAGFSRTGPHRSPEPLPTGRPADDPSTRLTSAKTKHRGMRRWWPSSSGPRCSCWDHTARNWTARSTGIRTWRPGPRHSWEIDLGLTTLHASVIARDSVTHAGLGHDPNGKSPNHSTPMPLGSITKTLNGQLLADSLKGRTLSPDRREQLPGPARHSRLPEPGEGAAGAGGENLPVQQRRGDAAGRCVGPGRGHSRRRCALLPGADLNPRPLGHGARLVVRDSPGPRRPCRRPGRGPLARPPVAPGEASLVLLARAAVALAVVAVSGWPVWPKY